MSDPMERAGLTLFEAALDYATVHAAVRHVTDKDQAWKALQPTCDALVAAALEVSRTALGSMANAHRTRGTDA